MRIPQSGLRLDNPAWPLLRALGTYFGITTANGNAGGTSLVDALCSTAGGQPPFDGQAVKILGGPSAGQVRPITVHTLATGTLEWFAPTSNPAGAVQQILAGTPFCIIPFGGGGGLSPVIGFGTFTTSSQTVPADNTRAGLYAWENNAFFKGSMIMPIEGICILQPRPIGVFTVAGGIFGLDEPFSQLPGFVRYVILASDYPVQRLIDIFNLVNAILVTTETGGTILTTGPGTEDNIYINNAPAGVYKPLKLMLDFSIFVRGAENHGSQATETIVVRTYYRIYPGGNMIKKDEVTFAGVQDPPLKNVELEPNRYGIQITMERIAGNARYYDWSCVYEA